MSWSEKAANSWNTAGIPLTSTALFISIAIFAFDIILTGIIGAQLLFFLPKHSVDAITNLLSILTAILLITIIHACGYNPKETFRFKGLAPGAILPLVLLGSGLMLIEIAIAFLVQIILNSMSQVENLASSIGIGSPSDFWDWLSLGFALIVIVPFLEEVTVRGMVLSSVERRYGIVKGIIVTSVLFMTIHYHKPASMLAAMGLSSIIQGWVVYKTNSIYSGILLHSLNNALVFIARLLNSHSPPLYERLNSILTVQTQCLAVGAMGIISLLFGYLWLNKILAFRGLDRTAGTG